MERLWGVCAVTDVRQLVRAIPSLDHGLRLSDLNTIISLLFVTEACQPELDQPSQGADRWWMCSGGLSVIVS